MWYSFYVKVTLTTQSHLILLILLWTICAENIFFTTIDHASAVNTNLSYEIFTYKLSLNSVTLMVIYVLSAIN